ncbi:hypothetical protein GJ744_003409 [Endocarpon pusillum]|uniref:Uncharacterized protein n=1 Tax=Endocarpon pusillum TaxID=364733 RepID=A0A8H7AAP2_9EURO|nr:hypothetical protein GJ744_003409 [Endocarpon pusillum]
MRLGGSSQARSEDVELGENTSSFATFLDENETEWTSWTCCNPSCSSRENKTDVKVLNPECASCKQTRCASCTIKAVSPVLDAALQRSVCWQRPYLPLLWGPGMAVYYCCNCGNGPQTVKTNPYCGYCGVQYCVQCTTTIAR